MSSEKELLEPTNNDNQVIVKPADDLIAAEPHELAASSAGQEAVIQKDIEDRDMVKDKSP